MPRVYAISNQKGGVGKTTTAMNLASALALEDKRVLLIDIDPQGNASSGLGHSKSEVHVGIADVLLGFRTLESILLPTCIDGLHLAPATRSLVGVELDLVDANQREFRLRRALGRLCPNDSTELDDEEIDIPVNKPLDYDYVVIDCPPSLSLLTVNALAAADGVIIPMQAEYYAMEGLSELLRTINQVRKGGLNRGLRRSGILLTMVDRRTNLCREVCDEVRGTFGTEVFQTEIPRNVRLGEAPSFQKTIHAYDPLARGAIAYTNIALELLDRDAAFEGNITSTSATPHSPTTLRAQEAS